MKAWTSGLLIAVMMASAANADVFQFRGTGVLSSVTGSGGQFPEATAGDQFILDYTAETWMPGLTGYYAFTAATLTIDGNSFDLLAGGRMVGNVELTEWSSNSPGGPVYWDEFDISIWGLQGSSDALSLYLITERLPTPSNALLGTHHPTSALNVSSFNTRVLEYRSAMGDNFAGVVTSMAPIPLPGAAWLLLSGLVPLLTRRSSISRK
jgi:hypothetical protein